MLVPETEIPDTYINPNLFFQINVLNIITAIIVIAHIGFIFFALLHAILGQYFYVPFLVENIELHVGPRPTYSIYSGGNTAWQNPKEKKQNRFTKLWYGWFGSGSEGKVPITKILKGKILNFVNNKFTKLLKTIARIVIEIREKRQRTKRRKRK